MSRQRGNDTLNVQIDKLSEAIESMMKEFNTLQTPRVLDSEITRTKPQNSVHVGLTGDEDLSDPDSFCREPEYDPGKIELYLDRVSMIAEDFRSFEARKVENSWEESFQSPCQVSRILEEICNRVYAGYNISLPFSDLEDFIGALQKVVEKQVECSLVDIHGFILNLCDVIQNEKPGSSRISLGNSILTLNIKERPRKRFQKPDYSVNYDAAIEKILQDKDLPEEVKSIGRVKKNFLVSIDMEKMLNTSTDSLKEDLAHQLAEANMMKKKLVAQLEGLSKFSKQLRSKDIELIKLKESLQESKEELEADRKAVEDLENSHAKKIQEIKQKISEVCPDVSSSIEIKPRLSYENNTSTGRFSPLVAAIRASTPVTGTRPAEPDDLTQLQNELLELEAMPQDGAVLLKINRLKTQISAIRSATAINNSLRNSSGNLTRTFEHKRNGSGGSVDNFQISPSPLPRSGCSSPIVPDAILSSSLNLKRTAPRPPAPGPRKANFKVKETPDEVEVVFNQLKVQESRLKEREELLQEKENRLHRNWMKVPNGSELVGLVQKELNYLSIIKKEYEDKFEELNIELSNFSKKNKELRIRERELESRMIEAGKDKKGLEDEKKSMEGKFEAILNLIESL
jgi:hypothetical protein